MARTWSAVLARLGVPTGDRRIIAPGALTNRDLPLPLMWQRVSDSGHSGSVTVGAIETLTIDNATGMVMATGSFLPVRGAAEAQMQTEAGVTGPSIDIFDDIDVREVQTLIEAGVVGPNLMDDMDDIEYAMDDDGMIVITRGRIAGATLVQIPAFAGVSIEMADGDAAPWTLAASASAAVLPSVSDFSDPGFKALSPLVVDEAVNSFGYQRVSGHIAPWGQCHIGLPGCVTAPFSASGYAYFHTGEQLTREGAVLPVGTLVAGPRHADPRLAFQAATAHYDDPEAAVAKVVAGEDEFGIWVSGWVLPSAVEAAVNIFRSSPVSGDWRRIGGSLELVAVCSVNAPGFPVPRARVAFSSGAQRALIGSFGVTPVVGGPPKLRADRMADALNARARWAWANSTGTEY